MYSSSPQGLPAIIDRIDAPRVSTPLNLTPPDLGEFIQKSRIRAIQIQTPNEDGNDRFVAPCRTSSDDNDTDRRDKMARGGSGSVAKQPFLEVLDRCGQLEMENQV